MGLSTNCTFFVQEAKVNQINELANGKAPFAEFRTKFRCCVAAVDNSSGLLPIWA
jgi:hypothetical protein